MVSHFACAREHLRQPPAEMRCALSKLAIHRYGTSCAQVNSTSHLTIASARLVPPSRQPRCAARLRARDRRSFCIAKISILPLLEIDALHATADYGFLERCCLAFEPGRRAI
jgi:hypothetical protein